VRFDDARSRLETAFRERLPGVAAQQRLAPVPAREWPPGFDVAHVRHAAVLLLLFPHDSLAQVILTVRADTLGRHGGQVSLPGGVVESGETLEAAALREAYEEVALPPAIVRLLGPLTPVDIPVSGFRLHPIVAFTEEHPLLLAADGEVARLLEIPVADLLDPAALTWRTRERSGVQFAAPTLAVAGVEIWGATAMVLAEFLTMLGWEPPL
jgi:8-oxo-dGTP pyrophosphatase MutT (NUDIX family)